MTAKLLKAQTLPFYVATVIFIRFQELLFKFYSKYVPFPQYIPHTNLYSLTEYRLCSVSISSGHRSSTAGAVLFSDLRASSCSRVDEHSFFPSFLPQSYYHADLIHSTVTDHRWFFHPNTTYWCCNVIHPLMVCTDTESASESQEKQEVYKMSGIIVFLGTDMPWILEAIHSWDIPISQRFCSLIPCQLVGEGFTISWDCASVERVIFQWHLQCFFWLGENGSNPRHWELEKCCRTKAECQEKFSLFVYNLHAFSIRGIYKKKTFICFSVQMLGWDKQLMK